MKKRVKIVCTLGPSCSKYDVLRNMVQAGMNVARLNFSHGDYESHGRLLDNARRAEKDLGMPIPIMIDTKGPEIRTGTLAGHVPVVLKGGDFLVITTRPTEGNKEKIYVDYPGFVREVAPGRTIFIDDGRISLKVEKILSEEETLCKVVVGGELGENKGVSVPGALNNLPILTKKDINDIKWAISRGADYLALSFVRTREDVLKARKLLEDLDGDLQIISKIETMQAVRNLEEIIEVSDGVMVARGDLGVEIPLEEVPMQQKRIIDLCRFVGKPVIVATQMLDSMIRNPRATRAECSDVANAVLDGADALMLSGETAQGKYPVEAVQTMAKIIERTEKDPLFWSITSNKGYENIKRISDAVGNAAVMIAKRMDAHGILCMTQSGSTAQIISKYRPKSKIIGATPSEKIYRKLGLVWGVHPLKVSKEENLENAITAGIERALEEGMLNEGDLVVVTAGVPVGISGTTNIIEVVSVGQILLKGMSIMKKVACGKVVTALNGAEAAMKISYGDILVCRQTDKGFVEAAKKASAIIAEEGGLTSHAAILSLELRIPCIVSAKSAMTVLEDGMIVTVDGNRGIVYRGRVHLESKGNKSDESGENVAGR
jgi:pyruvate kinase